MSWANVPAPWRQHLERVLTEKQLEAYRLWEDGLGYSRIAAQLGISTSSARDRIHRALRIIETHLERTA